MAPALEVHPTTNLSTENGVNGDTTARSSTDLMATIKTKVQQENGFAVQPSENLIEKSVSSPGWLLLNHMKEFLNQPVYGATKLRKMIFETNELIVCPGVYDGLSARTAMELGFSALYMVSSCRDLHFIDAIDPETHDMIDWRRYDRLASWAA
jgi:hypothetical protein